MAFDGHSQNREKISTTSRGRTIAPGSDEGSFGLNMPHGIRITLTAAFTYLYTQLNSRT
jgi:hypothetical protein